MGKKSTGRCCQVPRLESTVLPERKVSLPRDGGITPFLESTGKKPECLSAHLLSMEVSVRLRERELMPSVSLSSI